MNTSYTLLAVILIPGMILVSTTAYAQRGYSLLDEESSLQITGTSTIHDWECSVEELDFSIALSDGYTAQSIPESAEFIQSASLIIPVSSIESGRRAMNSKIYDALDEDDNPNIRFQFVSGSITASDSAEGTFTINVTGDMTVAGVTRSVTFPVQGSVNQAGNIAFSGSYSLNMQDYNIEPPTAVLGTIRSGEEVDVVFNLVLGAN